TISSCSQISRLSKIILKNLSQFTFKKYKQQTLSEKDINQIIDNNLSYIKEYLKFYSREFFEEILWEIITKEVDRQEKSILKHHFEELKAMPKEKLNLDETDRIKQKLKFDLLEKSNKNYRFHYLFLNLLTKALKILSKCASKKIQQYYINYQEIIS
ncbi:MAG: hypothetical protein HC763_28285, partial [Hydrococcus sp. CRU_1_1]|nr:hypothetical protein [Hydrococcus sp. CRU_1_1]